MDETPDYMTSLQQSTVQHQLKGVKHANPLDPPQTRCSAVTETEYEIFNSVSTGPDPGPGPLWSNITSV